MNQYTTLHRLGQGAFSTVYKVKRKEDNKEYAMKKIRIMNLSEKELANCLNEVRILASIQDPHILAYKDSFFDELTNTFCLVTQCLQGGDIFKLITQMKQSKKLVDQNLIWKIAQQCLRGLKSLHDMQILHRDIKSANIFLNKDQTIAKLADMNVSIVTSNGMAKTQTGTPYYASPQVWMDKPYSAKCDIWSLGCVLYQLASLRPPFMASDLKSLKKLIIAGVYKRIPIKYSSDLDNFIRECLKVDTKERPSAGQLLENQYLKKRIQITKDANSQSGGMSSVPSCKLLQKILPPKKRQFRIVKDRLPKNRFDSCQSSKTLQNQSYCEPKTNENFANFVNTSKITKKDNLPSIERVERSSSLNVQKRTLRQFKVLQPCRRDDMPPMPPKALRA